MNDQFDRNQSAFNVRKVSQERLLDAMAIFLMDRFHDKASIVPVRRAFQESKEALKACAREFDL